MTDIVLLARLREDLALAEQLAETLEREFDALKGRRLSELEALLANKQFLLAQLDQHGRQLAQRLLAAGLPNDRQGFEQLANRQPDAAQLIQASRDLNAQLELCKQRNLRNGRIIQANQTTVKRVIGILHGGDASGGSLYDKRGGSAAAGDRPRTLIQA